MIRQKILQQLLEWIECNLDHPISIEDIAQKSGYSRRNIQLLFRNFMHMPLGSYIRKRRLCRAAILVRLTAKLQRIFHSWRNYFIASSPSSVAASTALIVTVTGCISYPPYVRVLNVNVYTPGLVVLNLRVIFPLTK